MLQSRVRMLPNRAAIATAQEVCQFQENAIARVMHLKHAFPWLGISFKFHLFLFHAANFI